MDNQEAADELQYAIDLIKQDGKDWLDERDIPILEAAISALQVQEAKTQLSAEGTTSDLISRQDALDALEKIGWIETKADKEYAIRLFTDLPSAQPEIEERTEEFAQNVPKEDLISRKAAIEAMSETLKRVFPEHRQIAEKCLNVLPSAQPEPCKDAVSREAAIDVAENAFVRGLLASPDIRKLPSAQPEIVRCKDCKYCDRGIDEDGNPFLKCLGWVYGGTQEEDFCSHAERRTDDANDIT